MFFFRTVGGSDVGLGHLFRCLAVANAVRDLQETDLLFVVNNEPVVKEVLSRYGFPFVVIDGASVSLAFVESLAQQHGDDNRHVVYIDMKGDIGPEIRAWRGVAASIMLMDNLSPANELADIVVLPVPFVPVPLRGSNIDGTRVRYGGEWVPVASRFQKVRRLLPVFRERKCILVTVGGADPNRLVLKLMRALASIEDVRVKVVMGFAAHFKSEVYNLNKSLGQRFEIIENTDHMELLMKDAGLAVTALGTTIYELATLGVPTVVLSNYRDDKMDEYELSQLGWILPLGYHLNVGEDQIRDVVSRLWDDIRGRENMSTIAMSTIDGRGAERISRELMNLVSVMRRKIDPVDPRDGDLQV
ncbi:MAG: hypothetical protein M1469_04825 [Bacteroidetes bacterium]|nr:hypothetical protein [Bacteroidota bacterium]